jgi:hypothetical protein
MFRKRVLRRIFRPKRLVVTAGWRKRRNEELDNTCSSQNVITMITSRHNAHGRDDDKYVNILV